MKNTWRKILKALAATIILSEYFGAATGKEYGIGIWSKLRLSWMMFRNTHRIPTASDVLEHLVMATRIMNIPSSVEGCVVECGSFKGGSAANLSLVCHLCNRQLEICDSFSGLPAPLPHDIEHGHIAIAPDRSYSAGEYSGSLEEVRANIGRCGKLELCHFNPGFFADTLPGFCKPCAFIFLDVDLGDSLKTCLLNLWPQLKPDCFLFTHEARDAAIAAVFFDSCWWQKTVGTTAPGLIGAGSGLGLLPSANGFSSDLGYTRKIA